MHTYKVRCTLDGAEYEQSYAASNEKEAIELYKTDLTQQYPQSTIVVMDAKLVEEVKEKKEDK